MEINEEFALFYGILLGDGSIGKYGYKKYKNKFNYNINITCNALDDWPFTNKVILPILKEITGKEIFPRKDIDRNSIRINFSNKPLFYFLKGIGFPVGKKGQNLIIPSIFYEKNLIKYIIQGFFATDGCICLTKNPNKYYPRIESQTIHKKMILQIKDYLEFLGMKGKFYDCKSKPSLHFKNVQARYKFQFNGKENLLLFEKHIGFVNPKHKDRFSNFLKYSETYDQLIAGVPSCEQKYYRLENMTPRGFEPRTTSS